MTVHTAARWPVGNAGAPDGLGISFEGQVNAELDALREEILGLREELGKLRAEIGALRRQRGGEPLGPTADPA